MPPSTAWRWVCGSWRSPRSEPCSLSRPTPPGLPILSSSRRASPPGSPTVHWPPTRRSPGSRRTSRHCANRGGCAALAAAGILDCSSGCWCSRSGTAIGSPCPWMRVASGRGRAPTTDPCRGGCSMRSLRSRRSGSWRSLSFQDARFAADPSRRRHVTEARTIVFFPEGAYGPTNNCVGIGQVLRSRGHRVVFVVEESFAGTLEAKGFEERLMRLGPPPAEPEIPGQFWIDFIRDTAPVFRKPTIEQLGDFIAPTFQALIDGSKYVDPRLAEIFDEVAPDVIVEDNVVAFPAIAASGRPWVRIVSCNPMEMKDPLIAPFSSGYPVADSSEWPAFLEEVQRTHRDMWADFDTFCREHGEPGLRYDDNGPAVSAESPFLNLYSYPAEADYER